jgi:SAM-dependent methyltransferase
MPDQSQNDGIPFDYEAATWGADRIRPDGWSIASYRLSEVLAGLPERGRVLEVGCGAGRYLRALAELRPDLELVGCDVSRKALDQLASRAPSIEHRLAMGETLPAETGEFDAVLVIDVLEHVPDPVALLRDVRRILADAGRFHLHVPCEGDPLCLWRWLPGQSGPQALKQRLAGHVQRFRRRQLLETLAQVGFETMRVRNSLHVLGNLADVAAFLRLRRANREGAAATTTGDLVAAGDWWVRGVDAVLWAEARLLSRVPSWSIHVWSRRLATLENDEVSLLEPRDVVAVEPGHDLGAQVQPVGDVVDA